MIRKQNNFGAKYGSDENIAENRMDKYQRKRIRKTQGRSRGENATRSTQSNTQNVPNWKKPGHDGIDCLEMYKISSEVMEFIENTIKNWKVELTAKGKSFAEVNIQRGIF